MSDSEENEEPKREQHEVEEEVQQKCLEAFQAFDTEGTGEIQSGEVKLIIEMMGINMNDQELFKIISEIDPENTGQIKYSDFKPIIVEREVERIMGSDEEELLDAYVAMGGEADGGGCVDAAKLINTIKNEFQMTIDIEKLIEEIDEDGSGEIEFDEFKQLLCCD